jgi:hypothetical protein
MIQVRINFFGSAIFLQHSSQHSNTTQPQHVLGHASSCLTLSLSRTGVTTLKEEKIEKKKKKKKKKKKSNKNDERFHLSLLQVAFTNASARVNNSRFLHNQTVTDQATHILTAVCQSNV